MSENSNAAIAVRKNGKWFIGQGGGVKTYDDLAGKPFYENVTYYGDTITWDGEPTEISVAVPGEDDKDMILYHVSPTTPRIEDIVGAAVISDGNIIAELSEENCFNMYQDNFVIALNDKEVAIVVHQDGFSYGGIVFPKKGVYSGRIEDISYPVEIKKADGEFAAYDVKKIDKKYLPDSVIAIHVRDMTTIDLSQYPVGTMFVIYGDTESLSEVI